MTQPVSSMPAPVPTPETASAVSQSFVNKDTFLRLLVAQLKNQDPLNPADGTAFVAQLAQLTQLEQTIAMKEDLAAIRSLLAGAAAAGHEPAEMNP
jgi:flagellar basal-body rod modification protein FlgD